MSYSGNICIFYPVETDFKCSVKAEDLIKVVSQIKGDVRITFSDAQLRLEGDFEAGFVSQYTPGFGDDIDSVQKELKDVEWKELPTDFIKGALLTHFAASTKDALFMNCLMVDGKDIVATDRIRLGYYQMDSPMDSFFIRAKTARYVASIKPTQYVITDAWAYFKTKDDVVVGSRRMLGDFPSYKDLVNMDTDESIEIPSALSQAIRGVAVLSDEDDSLLIDVKAENNKLTVSSHNERGWAQKTIDIEYDGDYEFSIDPSLMLQALRQDVVNLKLYENFVILESGKHKHLISKKHR
jgi:DNA polymerase III sliding clamp (beta) subunit (PCNA family)